MCHVEKIYVTVWGYRWWLLPEMCWHSFNEDELIPFKIVGEFGVNWCCLTYEKEPYQSSKAERQTVTHARGLHVVALFKGAKGLLVLLVGFSTDLHSQGHP